MAGSDPDRGDTRTLPSPLMIITDRLRASKPLTLVLQEAERGGARWIRIREPDLDLHAYIALCDIVMLSVPQANVMWSVRPQAFGILRTSHPERRIAVHLTEQDAGWAGPEMPQLIGRSVHVSSGGGESVDMHVSAHDGASDGIQQQSHPDYVLLAPLFATVSKPGADPIGLADFSAIAENTTTPVVALGGVTADRVSDCKRAGASAVAVCGGVMEAHDTAAVVRAYLDAWMPQDRNYTGKSISR